MGSKMLIDASHQEETRVVVLEMYPAPGTLVNLGDTIRITVPGGSGDGRRPASVAVGSEQLQNV